MKAYNEVPAYCEIKRLARLREIAAQLRTGAQCCTLIDEYNGFLRRRQTPPSITHGLRA
jgi:hypothetical protein